MTREEALDTMGATLDDWIDKKNIHMLIDKIYDGFEAHVDDLRDVIDTYMEQAAMYKNLYEKAMK